eukprot:scaffold17913_cov57-Phaeocystis_antarctica.AAC.2
MRRVAQTCVWGAKGVTINATHYEMTPVDASDTTASDERYTTASDQSSREATHHARRAPHLLPSGVSGGVVPSGNAAPRLPTIYSLLSGRAPSCLPPSASGCGSAPVHHHPAQEGRDEADASVVQRAVERQRVAPG